MKKINPIISVLFLLQFILSPVWGMEKTGALLVTSERPVAVYLDNVFVGQTPLSFAKIQCGSHNLYARSGSRVVFEKEIKVVADQKTAIVVVVPPFETGQTTSDLGVSLMPRIEPAAEAPIEKIELYPKIRSAPPAASNSASNIIAGVGCHAVSFRANSSSSPVSYSGLSGYVDYDFGVFNVMRCRVGAELDLSSQGYFLPLTTLLIFDLKEAKWPGYLGGGVTLYLSDQLPSAGTGYRLLYGLGPYEGTNAWLIEAMTDVLTVDTLSVFKTNLTLGYRF